MRIMMAFATVPIVACAHGGKTVSKFGPQLFSRTHYMDWWNILEGMKKKPGTAKAKRN